MVGEENVSDSNWFDDESVHKAFATLFTYYNHHEEYNRATAEKIWFRSAKIEKTAEGQAARTGQETTVYDSYEKLELHRLKDLYNRHDLKASHGPVETLSTAKIIKILRDNNINDHQSTKPIMILNDELTNAEFIQYQNDYSWLSGLKMPIDDKKKYFKNEWEHVLPIFHQMIFAGGLAGYSYWDAYDIRRNTTDSIESLSENIQKIGLDTLAPNPMTSSQIYHRIGKLLQLNRTKYMGIARDRELLNMFCIAKSEKFLNQCKSDSVFVCLKRRQRKYQYHVDNERIKDFFDGISLETVVNPDMIFKDNIWKYGRVGDINAKDGDSIRTAGKPSNHSYTYITKDANKNQIALGKCLGDDFILKSVAQQPGLCTLNLCDEIRLIRQYNQDRDTNSTKFNYWKEMAIHNVKKVLEHITKKLNKYMIERTLLNCIFLLCYSHKDWELEAKRHKVLEHAKKDTNITGDVIGEVNSAKTLDQLKKACNSFKNRPWMKSINDIFEEYSTDGSMGKGASHSIKQLKSYQTKQYYDEETGDVIEQTTSDDDQIAATFAEPSAKRNRCQPSAPRTPNVNRHRGKDFDVYGRALRKEAAYDSPTKEAPNPDWSNFSDIPCARECKSVEYFVGKCIRCIHDLDKKIIGSAFINSENSEQTIKEIIGNNLSVEETALPGTYDSEWQKGILIQVLTNCIHISYQCEPTTGGKSPYISSRGGGGSSKKVLKTKRGKKKLGYKKRK